MSLIAVQSTLSFANTTATSSVQQLADTIQQHTYAYVIEPENIQPTVDIIMDYFEIDQSSKHRDKLEQAVKQYYNAPETKQKYTNQIKKIYEKTMTEQEIQTSLKFFQTPVGESILKNKAYYQGINSTVEQLFPEDQETSADAEKKMVAVIETMFEN